MARYQFRLTDAGDNREEYIRIFTLYCQELIKEDPTIAKYDPGELAEENLQTPSHHPYLIKADGETAGLVVFMDEENIKSDRDCHTYIGEIYVMSQYRKQGIAGKIVTDYIRSLQYDTGLCYIRGSYAEKYWNKLMTSNGYRYRIDKEDEIRDFIHIFVSEN